MRRVEARSRHPGGRRVMRGRQILHFEGSLTAAASIVLLASSAVRPAGKDPERERPPRRTAPSPTTCLPPEDVSGQTALLRLRNGERAAKAQKAKQLLKGDVSVIEDRGSIVTPEVAPNPFDLLGPVHIDLTPVPGGFALARGDGPLEPPIGEELFPADDGTTEVALPFAFPFYGANYTSIWVNSDGNITLGEGDAESFAPRDAARLVGGPPRIAPCYTDLLPQPDPSSIRVAVSEERVVVSWTRVFAGGGSGTPTIDDFPGDPRDPSCERRDP